jgi:hypothetical protein
MIRVGVISDTHLRSYNQNLAQKLAKHFKDVQMILHAGDITELSVLDMLDAPQVIAVLGNMDGFAAAGSLPAKRLLKLEGFQIGLIHGYGPPNGLGKRVRQEFDDVDAIVFGHSHKPTNYVQDGVLYFNPGSASDGRGGEKTVGILTIGDSISGEIIEI